MSSKSKRRNRWHAAAWLMPGVAGLLAVGCPTDEPAEDPLVREGRELYAQYCALCHGTNGEGYKSDGANALANQQFLASASDELLRTGTARGRPDTPMSPWGAARGGPLSDHQVDAIVAMIRKWQTVPSVEIPATTAPGSVDRARPLYEFHCAVCHGDEGQGAEYMSLRNPEFLAVASDGFLRLATADGRTGTPMPAFASMLTPQGIDDLVVLMRSWQEPVDDTPYVEPSKDLGPVVLNKGGGEPPFADNDREDRFIAADLVKQAMDSGLQLALLDARPPSDYVHSHITGARSVPFYLGETYLDQLDPNWTFVTYCGCPHSISGQLHDLLEANGFSKVWVLDEGFFVWQERGYPVTIGPSPE